MAEKIYSEWPHGVINAIDETEIPFDAVSHSDKMIFKENRWRKLPGLTEINGTPIGVDPVWSVFSFNQILPVNKIRLATSGGDLYKFDEQSDAFISIHNGLNANQQVSFLEDANKVYFGSQRDLWRRYDGGLKTYTVGGANPPKMFSKIIFNPYAGRYFGIGNLDNPDYLYWSNHLDNGGIEVWPDANTQIIESEQGDFPLDIQIYQGRLSIFSKNSIHSGSVIGVPENWVFQREKSITGADAGRTVKRHGRSFIMFAPDESGDYGLYKWPDDTFISKGRVKFDADPAFSHLACAEIIDNRYYVIAFKSNQAVSSNKYHLWYYDILGDRFYGPSTQYNVVSMFYDKKSRLLHCGGTDNLSGFVMEHRGNDIKGVASACHFKSSFSDYGTPFREKRFNNIWIKAKQTGEEFELTVNVANRHSNPHAQGIKLEDLANKNPMGTGSVRRAVNLRGYIHDAYSLGESVSFELKHAVLNGEFEFSTIGIEYDDKGYKKEKDS